MAKANESKSEGLGTSEEKITPASKKIIIAGDTEVKTVLELDVAGKELLFDGRSDFVDLPDEVVSALSRSNKQRYLVAKEFHESWRPGEDVSEYFEVNRQNTGTATNKLDAKLPKGMRARWTRPELVASRMERGYKIVHQEGKSYVGEHNGVHKISSLGRDELVLMAIPEKQYADNKRKQSEANVRKAGLYKESFKNQATQQGIESYDEATDTQKRSWNEIESLEN